MLFIINLLYVYIWWAIDDEPSNGRLFVLNRQNELLKHRSRTCYHTGYEPGMVYVSVPLASSVPIGI